MFDTQLTEEHGQCLFVSSHGKLENVHASSLEQVHATSTPELQNPHKTIVTEEEFEKLRREALLQSWPAPSTRDEEALARRTRTLNKDQLFEAVIRMLFAKVPTDIRQAQQLEMAMKVYIFEFYSRGYDPQHVKDYVEKRAPCLLPSTKST